MLMGGTPPPLAPGSVAVAMAAPPPVGVMVEPQLAQKAAPSALVVPQVSHVVIGGRRCTTRRLAVWELLDCPPGTWSSRFELIAFYSIKCDRDHTMGPVIRFD